MSLTGSLVILLVLLGRLVLRKQPKTFSYALWAVVLFRLLCPVSISAPVSALEVVSPVVEQTTQTVSRVSYVQQELQLLPQVPQSTGDTAVAVKKAVGPGTVAAWVWLAGVGIMCLSGLLSYERLRHRLVGASPWRGNILLSDYVDTPFVMGIFRPKIYLPTATPLREQRFIIAHEQHHIRRLDHIWKCLAYLALCVHWFNPLVWLSFVLAGKDMEMSCDEAVIRKLGEHTRADYATALLCLSTKRTIIGGTPLAFGEGDTKGRVKNMANWKKPKVWVSLLCALLCIAVLVACAVNPTEKPQETDATEPLPTAEAPAPMGDKVYRQLVEGHVDGYVFVNQKLIPDNGTDTTPVAGLVQYEIPDAVDWSDATFAFLEELGIPDVDDPTLAKIGGTDSHCNWLLEVFSDVPQGQPVTVHRYHEFTVVVNQEGHASLMDVWYDATKIDYSEFAGFISFPYMEAPEEDTGEQEAFQRCMGVIANVATSSHQLHAEAQGPGGSTTIVEEYKIHDGDCLHIEQVDGSYQEALLVVGDQYFYGTGDIGGEIAWKSITREEYAGLHMQWFWLGHSTLTEATGATYMGTMNESQGPLYNYQFEDIYAASRWGVAENVSTYQVAFQFDWEGSFLWTSVFANGGTEKEVLAKESIVSLEEATVRAAIQREYLRATGQE